MGPGKSSLGWANSHFFLARQPYRVSLLLPLVLLPAYEGFRPQPPEGLPVALLSAAPNKQMTPTPAAGATSNLPLWLVSEKHNLSLLCKSKQKNPKTPNAYVSEKGSYWYLQLDHSHNLVCPGLIRIYGCIRVHLGSFHIHYIQRDLLWRIDSWDYDHRGWKICRAHVPVRVRRLEAAVEPRRAEIPVRRSSGRGILSYSGRACLFVLFRPSTDWMRPLTLWRAICIC